jgi:cobalt-zinc-cadmium efflux system outer membrane protein
LLTLLNDRSPVKQFDITGLFEFSETLPTLNEMREITLDIRLDLKAAMNAVDKAPTDHKLAMAKGSTAATFGFDFGRSPSIDAYARVSVSIPLRIFDKNQGEKLRTQRDIDRNQRLLDATQAPGVQRRRLHLRNFEPQSDPAATSQDKVFATCGASSQQPRFFLSEWLRVAARLSRRRERGPHGSDQLPEPIGSYPTAASQQNFAVGREVIP